MRNPINFSPAEPARGTGRKAYGPPRLTVHGGEPPTPEAAAELRRSLERTAAARRLTEEEAPALDVCKRVLKAR